ncbi:MAG: hypothetical protein H8D94_01745 [Candidatus Pelagibacter sp.]|nr:hypothetical protein [Candidatus Pelagibacter sp.]
MPDNYIIKVGDMVKVNNSIPSHNGMLHENSICRVDGIGFPDKDMRVIDDIGKIWYVNYSDVALIKNDN